MEHYWEGTLDLKDPLLNLRKRSWEKFQTVGLPQGRTEAFQHVPLAELAWPDLPEQGGFDCCPPQGLICLPLTAAMNSYGLFLQNQRDKTLREEKDPFALLNGALGAGLFLYAPPQWKGTLEIRPFGTMPRLEIYLGRHSELTIIQTGEPLFINSCIEATLDEGSKLFFTDALHLKAQGFTAFRANLKRDSSLKTQLFTQGAKLARASYKVQLLEENCEALLQGLWSLKGEAEAHVHATVEHSAPYTRSRQHFKGVLEGKTRCSFEGKILVRPIAQKTEAYQLNNNLLLSDEASAHAKPNLEIFADDVKASHGATISQLDAEELFYLRSRGLDLLEAKRWLVKGFCGELIDSAPASLKEKLYHDFA